MSILGCPRYTDDIDILILADDLDRVWKIAEGLEYSIPGKPLSFKNGAVEIRRISKVDRETAQLVTLDLLLVTEQLNSVWEGRGIFETEDVDVTAVSIDGLIALKTLGGRSQDLADIERLRNES